MENWVNYAPFFGVAGVIFAFFLFAYVKSFPSGNEVMIDLEDQINKGAMAFLKREYSILVVFIAVVFALLWWGINWQTARMNFAGIELVNPLIIASGPPTAVSMNTGATASWITCVMS